MAREVRSRVVVDYRLGPMENGPVAGISAREIAKERPEYYRQLMLFRRGLMSSYDLDHPGESARTHEVRAMAAFGMIEEVECSVAVVFSHK